MTEEQKRIVGDLRMVADEAKSDMPIICGISTRSADLIEPLADEFHHEVECKALKDDLIDRMAKEFEQVKRERDAAINDMHIAATCPSLCATCKYVNDSLTVCKDRESQRHGDCWEWREMCKENGGVKE